MNPRLTLVTAGRVLRQIRRDRRTLAMMLVVPVVLMGLLAWVYDDNPLFDRVGPTLVAIFPFVVMFLATSVGTLRERTSGTLERLLTTPVGKGDIVLGYALAFGLLAVIQGLVVVGFSVTLFGLDVVGPLTWLMAVVVASGLMGTALGLLASAFAATEFQAVQMMPAFVLPQFLLCGLLVPRDSLPQVLEWISDVLPLSYLVDAAQSVATTSDPAGDLVTPGLAILVWLVVSLGLGSVTLRRRTP